MSSRDRELDRALDRALDDIRAAKAPEDQAQAAEDRVWQRLRALADEAGTASTIRSCADFQRLIPTYVRGELGDSRRLLLEDHLGECVPCRRAFRDLRRTRPTLTAAPRQHWSTTSRWLARGAAAAAIFVAVVGIHVKTDVFSFETGGLIHVDRIEGELFRVTESGVVPVAAGESLTLNEGRHLRTAQDSNAVLRLADDSRVEMRERSELAVQSKRFWLPGRRTDGVIDLVRGSVIVEASEQGSGHLFLRTDDCDVSVTGTVFSVNHGVKGSRVSVLEGEVRVAHAGLENVLLPGQQATTHPALARVPIAEEISWSADRERYLALLRELRSLGDEIDQLFRPGLRYSTELLDLAPVDTAVYFAMPNLSGELSQAYDVFEARVEQNALLREWWNTEFEPEHAARFREAIDKIAAYGEHLGEEVALTLRIGADSGDASPLFLARLTDSAAFATMIEHEIESVESLEDEAPGVLLVEGDLPADFAEVRDFMIFWIHDGLLAASPSAAHLRALDRARQKLPGATLAGTAFREQLAAPYDQGVEWLVGVDISRLFRPELFHPEDDEPGRAMLEKLGLLDARFAIGERRQIDEHNENRIVLSFNGPRQKLAAWLDEPGPIGALDYVSPEAKLVVGFATKDMELIVGELFELLSANDELAAGLSRFEREQGIDLRRDFAAALGGEFVFALDGPILPKPSLALITEVYDSTRLQQAIEMFVEQFNDQVARHGLQGLALEATTIGGREFHTVRSLDSGIEAHYLFDDGYGVFAASRGQIERALDNRAAGIRLIDAPKFQALLPRDAQADFSGLFYQELGTELAALAQLLAPDATSATAPLEGSPPVLAVFYGETDRISATIVSEGGLFGSSFASTLGALTGLRGLVVEPHHETVGHEPRPGA